MSLILIRTRHHAARWEPRLEGLETRPLLAALPTTVFSTTSAVMVSGLAPTNTQPPMEAQVQTPLVTQTDRAPHAVLTQSPSALTITFTRPFNPFSMTNAGVDFELDQVAANKTATPVGDLVLSEPNNLFAPTTTLVLTANKPLAVGHYRLTLRGSSILTWADDNTLVSLGVDQDLADFTIEPPGIKLSDATPLGTVSSTPIVISGALDLPNQPTDVALYQVTLPAGHFWRFGAEISAHRDGGTLTTDLSLFDAQGHLIVSSTVGRPDFLQDPYLFAGLAPGTYYIGVSDPGNIPGQPGGYNPVTGTPGSVPPTQAGGAFRLHLVAHPEDAPTELLGFRLNWADPLDQSPTSVTLAFSRPLNLDSLRGDPTQGLILQDQNGQTWPLTAVGGVEGLCQYTFLFDQRLPAGQYTLRLPSRGGLTDLAGLHPVAPGEPPGVLATWNVAPGTGRTNPNDLGALLHNSWDGVSRSDVIAPGGAVTYRFVVTVPGVYSLQVLSTGGPLAVLISGPNGQVAFDHLSTASGLIEGPVHLTPGVYYLQWIATGHDLVSETWTLKLPVSPDSLLDGVSGSGPALNLTLIAPGPPNFSSTVPDTATISGPVSVCSPGATATPASRPMVISVPSGSPGLVLTIGNTLVGLPNAEAEHVAAVGPGTAIGTTALAYSGPGVLQGVDYGLTPGRQASTTGAADSPGEPALTTAAAHPSGAADDAPVDGALAKPVHSAELRPDERLADSEWLTRVVNLVGNWFARPAPDDPELDLSVAPEPITPARDDLLCDAGQAEQAGLGAAPLGAIVVSVLALRLRRPVRRWLRRDRGQTSSRKSGAIRGAHLRF